MRASLTLALLLCALSACEDGSSDATSPEVDGAISPRADQGIEPAPDQGAEPAPDQGIEPTVDQGVEPAPDQGIEPTVDQGVDPPSGRLGFPLSAFFHQDVYEAEPAADSGAIIAALRAAGGWGNGDRFQIDFSLELLSADEATPRQTFEPNDGFYTPDCDHAPIPLPEGGNLEGEQGYACESDGDCHLIVWAPHERRLYEMWRADMRDGVFDGGCLVIWETDREYPEAGRGEQCTSADAAGFPIAPLLFDADEVASGEIDHAIRFILPNDRVRASRYVRPATHGTRTSGGPNTPAYGAHLRLRRDFPLETLPSEGARVVARALQRYGMYHADGGNIALTARSDRRTTAKWEGLLGPHDLRALQVEDFEVIWHSDPIEVTFDCERTPILE